MDLLSGGNCNASVALQQLYPMAERDAKLLQVLLRELGQCRSHFSEKFRHAGIIPATETILFILRSRSRSQLIQQDLSLPQVARVKAFREPVVDGS